MSRISREYEERNGQTLEIDLYYHLGGYNNFTSTVRERGYYASVTPVTLSTQLGDNGETYTLKTTTAFTGIYQLVHPVKRQSRKAEIKAENLFTEDLKEALINYVLKKNGLAA